MMKKGNTILITGGSSGVGLQLAKELIARKNKVLVCGRSTKKLEETKKKFPEVEIFVCDISKESECKKLYDWVSANFPDCNCLINNAAIVHRTSFLNDENIIRDAEEEFQTNILAPIRLTKLFLPHLLKKKDACIINISTGLVYAPKASYPFYNATKAALHSFTQGLRIELQDKPIKIIEVLFPAIDTPWHNGKPPKFAISVERAVEEMLAGLDKSCDEIKVGKVKLLYLLSRIAPAFAIKKINSM